MEKPPIELSEGNITRHRAKKLGTGEYVSDAQIGRLASAASSMRSGAEKLHELAVAIKSDPSIRGSQARLTFTDNAQKALDVASGKLHEAMKGTFAELERLHKLTAPPPPADKYVAQAIWQTLREAKTPDARREIIASDPTMMSAVAYAPASVSGMTQAERDHLVQTWSREHFPEESARKQRLSKALDDARRVSMSGEKYFADLVRAVTSPTIVESSKRVEAAQSAAQAATAVAVAAE